MSPSLLPAASGQELVPWEPHALHSACPYGCRSQHISSCVIKPGVKRNPPPPLSCSDVCRMLLFTLLSPGSLRGLLLPFHAAAASVGPLASPCPAAVPRGWWCLGMRSHTKCTITTSTLQPPRDASGFWCLLCLGLTKLSCHFVAELIKP